MRRRTRRAPDRRRTGPGNSTGRKWISGEPRGDGDDRRATSFKRRTNAPCSSPRYISSSTNGAPTTTMTTSSRPASRRGPDRTRSRAVCSTRSSTERVGPPLLERPVHEAHQDELRQHADRDADRDRWAEPQPVVLDERMPGKSWPAEPLAQQPQAHRHRRAHNAGRHRHGDPDRGVLRRVVAGAPTTTAAPTTPPTSHVTTQTPSAWPTLMRSWSGPTRVGETWAPGMRRRLPAERGRRTQPASRGRGREHQHADGCGDLPAASRSAPRAARRGARRGRSRADRARR